MEDKNKQLEPQNNEPQIGSGSLLATARKKQNRSVEEIAQELNLSVTQIKTIELDQTEGLPEPTYVRGYIRSYAKLLGLDAEEVLESYLHPNWQKSTNLDDIPRDIAAADDDLKASMTPVKGIVGLVLFISIGFLWYTGLLGDLFGVDRDNQVQQTQVVEQEASTSVVESDSDLQTTNIEQVDSNLSELNADQQESQPDLQPSDTQQEKVTEVTETNNDLILTFDQTCWVDIRDTQDNRLAYKSYAAGDTLTVTNKDKLHVFLGNAEGVNAIYQGQPLDISRFREGVYAKFSLSNQ